MNSQVLNRNTISYVAELITTITDINAIKGLNTTIGICGGSCTGKSTYVASALQLSLGSQSQVIAQDHFMLSAVASGKTSTDGWDHPNCFSIDVCAEMLYNLKHNIACIQPQYSFKSRSFVGMEQIEPSRIILFDGMYAGYASIREQCDLIVYVESPFYVRLLRRIFRNLYERYQHRDVNAILLSYLHHPLRCHKAFVATQRLSADIIINNISSIEQYIHRHNLMPLEDLNSIFALHYERQFEDGTTLSIGQCGSSIHFRVHFHQQCYLDAPIDRSVAQVIMTEEMMGR